ncbi:MAG: nucleotide-binding universal stress UspA family protein [Cellvibrionaceae bacterium]
MVVIPNDRSIDTRGKKILLVWNESREASRAMHASLPLMQESELVNIILLDQSGNVDNEVAKGVEIGHFLTRYKINSELSVEETNEELREVGAVVLACADENESDLIIIGGYGRSRLRDFFLGGVTRYLLHNSTEPLLLVY